MAILFRIRGDWARRRKIESQIYRADYIASNL